MLQNFIVDENSIPSFVIIKTPGQVSLTFFLKRLEQKAKEENVGHYNEKKNLVVLNAL